MALLAFLLALGRASALFFFLPLPHPPSRVLATNWDKVFRAGSATMSLVLPCESSDGAMGRLR